MKPFIFLTLLWTTACAGATREIPELPAPPPVSLAFTEKTGVLLANRIQLRLHPDFYSQVTYSVDRNFHQFEEKRGEHHVLMALENTSQLPLKPVKFWVGKLLFAATDRIQVLFHASHPGIHADATGKAVWTIDGREKRAARIEIQDGRVITGSAASKP